MQGNVAEAPGANIFIEKNGKLFTPPAGHILPGITRATVLELASSMDIPVEETHFTVQDIYEADAAFYCGTAAEVIGFESLDNRALSLNWADTVSKKIQQAYKNLVVQQPIQANVNAVV
jgi:branched-chain amino acid aminotransferase